MDDCPYFDPRAQGTVADTSTENVMIDLDTIEDADDCDGDTMHVYGRDPTTGQWFWQWLPVETLLEAGRGDLVPWLGEA